MIEKSREFMRVLEDIVAMEPPGSLVRVAKAADARRRLDAQRASERLLRELDLAFVELDLERVRAAEGQQGV